MNREGQSISKPNNHVLGGASNKQTGQLARNVTARERLDKLSARLRLNGGLCTRTAENGRKLKCPAPPRLTVRLCMYKGDTRIPGRKEKPGQTGKLSSLWMCSPVHTQFHQQTGEPYWHRCLSTPSDQSLADLSAMLTQRKILAGQASK